VERLFALLEGKKPGFPLPGGRVVARVTGQSLIFDQPPSRAAFLEVEALPMTVPGVTPLPWTRGFITARLLAEGGGATGQSLAAATLPLPGHQALIDLDRVSGALRVRPLRPGDRIQPLGMPGHRKLQDLLTDRKVPVAVRRQLPVVCDEEKILWVAGYCVSDTVKLTPATRSALRMDWSADPDGDSAPS
jgi:tRNA(Ile)-lysidine synthetase-like protein